MKRVLSIFMGLVIAALCLYSINEKRAALPTPEAEATLHTESAPHKDIILDHVQTVFEW